MTPGISLHYIRRRVLKLSLGSRIWDSSALLPTSHERAATKAHGPWRRVCKPHQRQRLETAKLPVSTPPKTPKCRARRPWDSSGGAGNPRAAGRGFLLARAPGAGTSTGGLQMCALRPGRIGRARCVRVSQWRPCSPLWAPGAVAHLPALLPPPSDARKLSTATLLSGLLTARDLGTRLRASPATPLCAAPSPADTFPLPPPLCPSSCSAREPRSPTPGLAEQPAPAASPGPGLLVAPAALPRFDPHLQLCPGSPSSHPSVLPSYQPPLAVSPGSGLLSLAAPARCLSGGWGGRCQ